MKKAAKKVAKRKATRRIRRSARNGKFVTEAEVSRDPEGTVTEAIKK